MDLQYKLSLLDQIYKIYHDFISSIDLACEKSCSTCCTQNVTITSLEGQMFLSRLKKNQKKKFMDWINSMDQSSRFQPKITINQLADLCMAGKEIPEEEKDDQTGDCPFLDQDLCSAYLVRPFHCRCMVSNTICKSTGYANMDEYILTVNNLFLQIIEHMDSSGFTGNLVDILSYLISSSDQVNEDNRKQVAKRWSIIPNRPAKILMIPSEHRQKVNPLLIKLEKVILKSQR